MNTMYKLVIFVLFTSVFSVSCFRNKAYKTPEYDTITTHANATGYNLELKFTKGTAHNYPLMAVWVEDENGTYLKTLYVAESIAKGVFKHGQKDEGKWKPGPIRRPAALPVWSHKRGVQEKDGLYIPTEKTPMPDAVTGATPSGNFILQTNLPENLEGTIHIFFEINQTWDWNQYWTNSKYPNDEDYKTSCQPALIYVTKIELNKGNLVNIPLELIGHAHYNGSNGEIFTNLETITTARDITKHIEISISKE